MRRILKNIEPIFQPGLIINKEYIEFDEMAHNAMYWHNEYHKLNTQPFVGSLKIFHTSHAQIGEGYWSTDIAISGENPQNSVVLLLPVTNNPVMWMGEVINPNEMVIIKNNNNIDYQTVDCCKMVLTAINTNVIEYYWQNYHKESFIDKVKDKKKLTIRDIKTKNMIMSIWYDLISSGITMNPDSYNETIGDEIEVTIMNSLLDAFTDETKTISKQKSLQAAKLARDYIFANFDNPISILDLCIATNSSKRTLHYGFKSLYGHSPAVFIKRMKLNFVRYDLLSADSGKTVTDIAFKWNFYHLSRFARDYYIMFGEYPSKTLKRSMYLNYNNL